MKRYFICVLCILLVLSLLGCSKVKSSAEDEKNTYAAEYQSIYISDEEKADWFAPIVKLISNQEELLEDERGLGLGYFPPNPDEPYIPWGHGLGLFDYNQDGSPELVVDRGGGSSGTILYEVFDIFTGEEVGSMDGTGDDGCWGIYYNMESGEYFPFAQYYSRCGWDQRSEYTAIISYNEKQQRYMQEFLFCLYYYFETSNYENAELRCTVYGEEAVAPSYHYELGLFLQKNCQIPHTGLKIYDWYQVSDEDDSYQERAEKMARMLLYGSGQKFIRKYSDN